MKTTRGKQLSIMITLCPAGDSTLVQYCRRRRDQPLGPRRLADLPDEPTLVVSAKTGDREAFERLAEPYRRELQLHCYRMLGGFHDAEDLVQETLLRAWRGLGGFQFEGPGSFRRWLYRIATNACLTAFGRRARRVLPEMLDPPADRMPEGGPATEIPWLEPYPDAALEGVADAAPGPDARYEMREAVQLAFIAAIQHLPPRQRAALLLRDVLGWSAAETGRLLDASVASVNSALQRAHATLEKRLPARSPAEALPDDRQRALLERYVRTWENADLDGFVALLREDAVFSMPPRREWYRGREAIRVFYDWAWKWYGGFRLVPTAANGQAALAVYSRSPKTLEWRPHSIHVLTLRDDSVAALTMFLAPEVFAAFGLPTVPPDERGAAAAFPQP